MSSPADYLPELVLFLLVLLTLPAVVLTFLLALRWQFSRVLGFVGGVFTVVFLLPGAFVIADTLYTGAVVTVVVVILLVMWTSPLVLARWLLVQRGFDSEPALRYATASVPFVAFASSYIAFVDFDWFYLPYLTGIEAAIGYSVLGLVVVFGPTGLGLVIGHIRQRIPIGATLSDSVR